jgi:hypothetical protein
VRRQSLAKAVLAVGLVYAALFVLRTGPDEPDDAAFYAALAKTEATSFHFEDTSLPKYSHNVATREVGDYSPTLFRVRVERIVVPPAHLDVLWFERREVGDDWYSRIDKDPDSWSWHTRGTNPLSGGLQMRASTVNYAFQNFHEQDVTWNAGRFEVGWFLVTVHDGYITGFVDTRCCAYRLSHFGEPVIVHPPSEKQIVDARYTQQIGWDPCSWVMSDQPAPPACVEFRQERLKNS